MELTLDFIKFTAMRKAYLFIACLVMVLGCGIFDEGKPQPLPNDNVYFIELYNNSSHDIKIERITSTGRIIEPYILKAATDIVVSHIYEEEPIPLFYVFGFSAQVIYDDDISILHTREPEQDVSRSLFFPSSYKGGKVTNVKYVFSYEFTDADYEEAVLLGG